jgi:predicted ATP-binding protein involved in virulence
VHAITPYGEVSFSDLSFGYQTMTAWLADIAYRLLRHYPDSSNPLLMPAIVLVDEIDLHLHPKWQRQLRDRLARHFPAVQFIATAHSPLMAQAYMSENLAVVRRDGDHVDIENEPRTVAGWRLDEVNTSDLFGLETPFSPDVEQLLDEQRELGAVSKRSPKQDDRLKELDERLRNLPQESDERDSRAMDIIRRAAARLEEMDGNT